jgi:hypothetical protein
MHDDDDDGGSKWISNYENNVKDEFANVFVQMSK